MPRRRHGGAGTLGGDRGAEAAEAQEAAVEREFRVHGATLDVSSRWDTGDVRLVSTAPSGRRIDRDTDGDDVSGEVGPTFESLHVEAPERGRWTATVRGARVAPEGEEVRIAVHQGPAGTDGPTARLDPDAAGATVSLDGSGSSVRGGEIVRYLWEFGDGASAAGVRASHTYDSPGSYRVSLAALDDRGRWGVVTAPALLEVE